MKKFVYCLLPLFCLQLNSCSSSEAFSLETIPEDINEEKITEITGFKNRIAYDSGYLNVVTRCTYNNKGLLINSHEAKFDEDTGYASGYTINDYEYDKNGLLTLEKVSNCDKYGEVKQITVHSTIYDEHKNPIKDRRYKYEPGEIVEEDDGRVVKTSYTYNKKGKIITIDEQEFYNGNLEGKMHTDFSYDKKQRLIKKERKRWLDDFDNPDGYIEYLMDAHTYKGNQVTTIGESTNYVGSPSEQKEKHIHVREHDSKCNLIHSLSYTYDGKDLESVAKRQEQFFEYNSKGLETLSKFISSKPTVPIDRITYRFTTYCGANNDKIATRTIIENEVTNNSNFGTGITQARYVRNYYDNKQRAIKQEIIDDTKGPSIQMVYLFEY